MTYTEQELAHALRREWRALRQAGALDYLLRPIRTRQWVGDRGLYGYVTLDYQVRTDLRLRQDAAAPLLVEHYWAVRTLNSRQDPNWEPSLNINVVHVCGGAVHASHVNAALRNALELQAAASHQGWFTDPDRATLYVRAVALGANVAEDAGVLASLEASHDLHIRVGAYRYSVKDGFTFDDEADADWFWPYARLPEASLALGADLFGSDQLPQHDFRWQGVNDGPVWDHATGLTTHNGRVL